MALALPTLNNYTANLVNQYSVANGVTLPASPYDDDGNLTNAPLPKDQNTFVKYHWNAENRLYKITSADESSVVVIYSYDALGRRINKQTTSRN